MGILPHIAARELGISPRTLDTWARAGRIKFERSSGGWRLYDPKDIERIRIKRAKRHSIIDAATKRAQGF